MQTIAIFLTAAVVIGICYVVDKTFTKLFRSKAQHLSGLAVRVSKKYGVFGVILCALGVIAMTAGYSSDRVLFYGGLFCVLLGIALSVYYLSFGIFYNGESFLVSALGKPSREYRHEDILGQRLYVITGGSHVIELDLADGTSISLQTTMDGVYPFLDTAFAGWCMQKDVRPADCKFYDPSKSWWFPHEEEA